MNANAVIVFTTSTISSTRRRFGTITEKRMRSQPAPSMRAASSSVGSTALVPARERVVEDAPEGIRHEHAHENDRGRGVEKAPEPLRAVGPPRAARYWD